MVDEGSPEVWEMFVLAREEGGWRHGFDAWRRYRMHRTGELATPEERPHSDAARGLLQRRPEGQG